MPTVDDRGSVLASKRAATTYRILVEIAQHQPAISQREIAEAVGVTSQAVSDYLADLADQGFVDKRGRGRYRITNEGVDWLITETDALREYAAFVAGEVLEEVEVETAIATAEVAEGERVSLTMEDGILHATPGSEGTATAVTVTAGAAGREVGVTNFDGVIEYSFGSVTILSIPSVREGGSGMIDTETVTELADNHDLLAIDAPEGLAALSAAGYMPDIQFGTAGAVPEAATKGLDVLLLAVSGQVSTHADALRDANVNYEVLDPLA